MSKEDIMSQIGQRIREVVEEESPEELVSHAEKNWDRQKHLGTMELGSPSEYRVLRSINFDFVPGHSIKLSAEDIRQAGDGACVYSLRVVQETPKKELIRENYYHSSPHRDGGQKQIRELFRLCEIKIAGYLIQLERKRRKKLARREKAKVNRTLRRLEQALTDS